MEDFFYSQPIILSEKTEKDYRLEVGTLPEKVSYKHLIPFILDQGKAPKCVGYSTSEATNIGLGDRMPKGGVSPEYIYSRCKELDGKPKEPGTQIKIACDVLVKEGACPWDDLPPINSDEVVKITDELRKKATPYKIKAYYRLEGVEEMKQALANGMLIVVGTLVTDGNWMDGDDLIIQPEGKILGAHASLIYGYDDALSYENRKGFFLGLNSWGNKWGQEGHYKMAYDYVTFKSDIGMRAVFEAWGIEFEKPLSEKKEEDALLIGIDPGHGGEPGAIGPGSTKEKDVALGISLFLDEALKRNGIAIVMTRTTDKTVSLQERSNLLNAKGVALAVSVHCNSSTSSDADYISTFIYQEGGKAETCATLTQREIVNVTGFKDGGVRTANLHMLRETKMPAILIEAGFISNPKQEEWLKQTKNQKALAEGICKGICAYLSKPYKEEVKLDECSKWAKEAQKWVVEQGISDGKNPKGTVTREEVWTMLYRMKGE